MKTARDRRDSRWDTHREQRRVELVAATITAVRRHGAGVGMDDIAAEAGTSKTAVYRHFRDRTGLYVAVCETVAKVLVGQIRKATDREFGASGRGPRFALSEGIDAYLRLIESDREVYLFVVHRPLLDPAVHAADPVTDLVAMIGDHVAGVIAKQFRRNGHDDPARARSWGHGLVGLVRGAADDWITRPDGTTRDELTARLTDLAWAGLAGPAPSPEVTA
ncbi:TetR/AcrR family transcriptional regulator [Pseudonocardia sp. T1-2H]|jgi:AcrR family transcriptional regulator|uniref:TetR/AcrR family transcriptional regulator n=1 Tax=Pseudonocardia sp. T1-2H TaxID=3128899 RepID=UPI003100BB4E